MPLIVNGDRVDDIEIEQEINRMRPQYQAMFTDQTPEEQEKQLREWARENVIEKVLIQQAAERDPIPIPTEKIGEVFNKMIQEHGGEKKFYENAGLTKINVPGLRKNIELQLRVERFVENLCKDSPKPSVQQAKKYYDKKPKSQIPFEQVKEDIFKQINEQNRNTRIERFLDELKAKAEITEVLPDQPLATDEKSRIKIHDSRQSEKQKPRTVKPLNSILVKPAGPDCNMACSYCFYLEKAELFSKTKVHRMSLAILEEMIRQVLENGSSQVSFGWQGGEPTLMGLPFYQKAVEFQQRYDRGKTVGNGLQTNGILIDYDWAKFLKDYNFLVGLSLDGPEHVHNHYRLMKGGDGSWDKVVDRAKLMLDAGVAVNALTVVTDYSAQFPEEIYNFHKDLGLTFQQYIPCIETDPEDPTKAAPFSVSPKKFGNFLCTLFDLWITDFNDNVPTTSIRHFDSVFHSYVGLPPPECTLLPECGIYVVVEHDGGVYSCDFFVEPDWKLGNIMDGNLKDFLNSDRQLEFGRMKSTLPDPCKSCQWLKYCLGGCTKDRIRHPGDNNLSHFCQSYQMFFEHADGRLRQLADRWQREQVQHSKREAVIQTIKNGEIKVGRNDPCPCGSGKKFKKCCGSE